ncbi:DUF2721 domain-containing protein [Desulfocurvus sp.]|uniref:DUF2721 domain-containing protein n=1 Tax=Desulfocurvus sp. TaxID=2871698 RepID=UPI0025C43E8F|nr:DUF2721 domain-containing protein [Desulfocurvus sp.]MCK9239684.1 DUF2721 domain-containing protein [Desulfocurvus sp.]
MLDITVTTPALLFPAISLLLLAYTNRFLVITSRIRELHDRYCSEGGDSQLRQIDALRTRLYLIRSMQGFGVFSLFTCVLCMFTLFGGWTAVGHALFGLSMILLMISLAQSLREIAISVNAMNILLADMERRA